MGKGQLNEKIQELAKAFLGREITTTELRLYPYLDFVMKNSQKIDQQKLNEADAEILQDLQLHNHIGIDWTKLTMTKKFYDYMNQVLWYGYVVRGEGEK